MTLPFCQKGFKSLEIKNSQKLTDVGMSFTGLTTFNSFKTHIQKKFPDFKVDFNATPSSISYTTAYNGVSASTGSKSSNWYTASPTDPYIFKINKIPLPKSIQLALTYPSSAGRAVCSWLLACRPSNRPTDNYKMLFYFSDTSYNYDGGGLYILDSSGNHKCVIEEVRGTTNNMEYTLEPFKTYPSYFKSTITEWDIAWFQINEMASSASGILGGTTYPIYIRKLNFVY